MAAASRLSIEVYSFVSCVASLVALVSWAAWVLVPDEWLHAWGITYYPDKWWAVAVPTHLVVTFAFIFCSYVALNMAASCPLDSVDMLRDDSTPTTRVLYNVAKDIPDLQDVDWATVNEYMFPVRRAGAPQPTE